MRIGLFLAAFTNDPGRPLAVAARAAEAGYDGVFVYDHLFPPGRPDGASVEPFALLAAAAAAHPELGVGVLVTRPGFRPLGNLAKDAAALGHLAAGGAVLGLGLGDRFGRQEHATLGLPFAPPEDRAETLGETAQALRGLFAGRAWDGGERVGPLAGPLLPAASVEVWIGGTSERVARVAARAADAWNGWGMPVEAFTARAAQVGTWARDDGRDPADVPPTWAGIVLLGRDGTELATLEQERAAKGFAMDIWRGTADDLRRFRDDVAATGATWLIPLAAGPADRVELVLDTLRS